MVGKISGKLLTAQGRRGTCLAGKRWSTIDFFVACPPSRNCQTDYSADMAPHKPPSVVFHEKVVELQVLALESAKRLPLEPLVGPAPPPANWGPALEGVREAGRQAMNSESPLVQDTALEVVFRIVANTMEEEVADALGLKIEKPVKEAE